MKQTEDEIVAAAEKYRNWGRWGEADERGTLNFVSPEMIVKAAGLVKQGKTFALAIPFDHNGPQTGENGRINPMHSMTFDGCDTLPLPHGIGFSDDTIFMPLQCATQWDALSHAFDRGKAYNGHDASVVSSLGAAKNGIEKVSNNFVGRGILLDIARSKGVESLAPGYAITEEDLEACVAAQGQSSNIQSGDFVLVRTGQMGHCKANGWGAYAGGDAPGLSFYSADWLFRNELAAIATDTWGFEVRPNELPGSFQPLHQVVLPNMGLHIGEIFDLEDLAEDCAGDGIYEFMFVAPPLPITGAVGSPINPYAIK
ncbi:MAG: cyclase family protein [Hyphomonadaceae bacterium]|nr:cyclase family protein [Hyphomonadaceae bacterium]